MRRPICMGIDPGPTTGIAILTARPGQSPRWSLMQVTHDLVLELVESWAPTPEQGVVAVERYVVGSRSGRSSTSEAGRITRELVGQLQRLAKEGEIRLVVRSAAEVKPWATDRRLDAVGMRVGVKSMGHALDGGRHGLFASVRDLGLPDPLSRKANS